MVVNFISIVMLLFDGIFFWQKSSRPNWPKWLSLRMLSLIRQVDDILDLPLTQDARDGQMKVCCLGFPRLRMFHVILVVTWILGTGVDPNDILWCFWEVKISAILPRSPSKVICQTFRCTLRMWFFIPKTWLLSWPKTCNKLMSNMESWQGLWNSFCVFCTNKHHFQHLFLLFF